VNNRCNLLEERAQPKESYLFTDVVLKIEDIFIVKAAFFQ
jgi:hypothetical protein